MLIVGAGPTGLVLALVLTRLGVPVRIIDQSAKAAIDSRALGVHARTLELYRKLGIADAAMRHGAVQRSINLWVRRSRVARVPLEHIGDGLSPFPFILNLAQDVHERLLIESLGSAGVAVERETRLLRFTVHESGVRATLARRDGSEVQCEVAYLAGCDGARSTVREGLGIGFPGGTYSGSFYVADVEAAAGPFTDGGVHVHLDTDDLLAVFAMKGERQVRLVGTIGDDKAGASHAPTFADVSRHAIVGLALGVTRVNWFSTYRVHHRVADRFRVGRAFLLGDAAHIHSPVGAQGMNTGIGDAFNLGWKLAAVMHGQSPETLLESYEPERIAFARRLVATTDRAFAVLTKPGAFAAFIRTRVIPIVAPLVLRFPVTRRFIFRTVSQISIRYPDSQLSEGAAGRVRGGDRMPWLSADALGSGGDDNFRSLDPLAWQVHVYGEARSDLRKTCAELGLPISAFPWRPEMSSAGLARDALYLVRPDGYVALADAEGDPANLRRYATRHRIDVAPERTSAIDLH